MAGLATIVAASHVWDVPSVMRAKGMTVLSGGSAVAAVGVVDHEVSFGTVKGSSLLVSLGEGATGAGVIVVSNSANKTVLKLTDVKSGGGSVSVNGPDGTEIANASPNITNAGSLFIDNAAGTLIGEINGDTRNDGAIIVHNAQGKEIGRVHQ